MMKPISKEFLRRFVAQLVAKLGLGLLTILPFAGAIWIIYWIFTRVDSLLQPIVRAIWGQSIPGVGFVTTILLIILLGYFASNVVGKTVIRKVESFALWTPIFHGLYNSIKQILEGLTAAKGSGRMQPVLVEFPRKGMMTIGFITNEITDKDGRRYFMVYIPTVPNPTSGFIQIMEESEIIRADIPLDGALKMAISAGKVVPEEVAEALLKFNRKAKGG